MERERAPQMSFSEWQQYKEIIGERETRLPHQWPLYALSQLSEGKMFELNHRWQSADTQSSPTSLNASGNIIKILCLGIKGTESSVEIRQILNVLHLF